MILKSQQVRSLSPEMDPLRMGMGWTVDDLSKPQIMVESTYGNSHPGSGHLNIFVEEAVRGVNDHGGKAALESEPGRGTEIRVTLPKEH